MSLEKSNIHTIRRVSYWFLDKTIGYGFKPIRALFFTVYTIILFAIVYGLIDLLRNKIRFVAIESIGDIFGTVDIFARYLYQSGITYTTIGFSDILVVNPLIGLLYVIEALLGVSVLSLFIVALTRKYFFGK